MTQQLATRRVTAGAFTREAVAALSRRTNEPQWLLDQRLAAWEQADRLPFPTGYERAWKYLNPDRVRVEAMALADDPTRHVQNALPDDAGSKGVIATSLDAAVRDHP